jgi:formylglycine-generating enzyme required for sulfatase activity
VTVRRGRKPFMPNYLGGQCSQLGLYNLVGSAGAVVEIATPGPYCFAAVGTIPNIPTDPAAPPFQQVNLQLRKTCDDPTSWIACDGGVTDVATSEYVLPHLTPTLMEAGTYYLVLSSAISAYAPTDVVLAVVEGPCDSLPSLPPSAMPRPAGFPLDLRSDPSLSPKQEPLPSMTVDRLVRVHLLEGSVGATTVTLTGACAGVMSSLGSGNGVDFDAATTCMDGSDPTSSVPIETLSPRLALPAESVQASFAVGDACPDNPPTSDVACIPGGPMVLGSSAGDQTSVPPRIAAVSTFWIDRHEVTIARMRSAFAHGLKLERPSDLLDVTHNPYCLWTAQPTGHENYAVTCVSWYGARAFCQFEHGDLPTEAQWEFAATGAGGAFKTTYPWGYDAPACTCDGSTDPCHSPAFGRGDANFPGDSAQCPGTGPLPVDARDGDTGDASPLGVMGLAGGSSETLRDSLQPFDSDCWRAAGVIDPICWEEEATLRPRRGGTFSSAAASTLPVLRGSVVPGDQSPYRGFRCVYAEAPP